jgi:hypothetical protein
MLAIRDQRSAVNLPADPDPEYGDRLVADKADDRGGGDRGEVSHRLRVEQAAEGFVAGDRGAEEDEGDDDHAGEILGTTIAIGKAPRRRPAGQQKCYPQRQRRGRIADVVDRVRQQRDAARQPDDEPL